jgi:hypothetical protein
VPRLLQTGYYADEEERNASTVPSKLFMFTGLAIGIAFAPQSVRFIGWRYEGGHSNDWDVLRLVIFLQ